jgi:hypothetical protein
MDAALLLLEKLLPLDLENLLKMTVSAHFLIDGLMDFLVYRCIMKGCGFLNFHFFLFKGEGGVCIFIHLQLPQNCWNGFNESW